MNAELHAFEQDDVTRAMPHAVGAEKSIISTMMQYSVEYIGLAVEEGLTGEHFYSPANKLIFEAMLGEFEAGRVVEFVSLVQRALDSGQLDRMGGAANFADLYTHAATPSYFRHHLQIVKDKFILRSLVSFGVKTSEAAFDAPGEAQETLDEAERDIMAIRDGNAPERQQTTKQAVQAVMDGLASRIKGEEGAKGLMTGFDDVDAKTGGLKSGNMFVIAARPSMGKTAFMMNIVDHVCVNLQKPTMVFSLEMDRESIIQRMVFSRAKYHEETNRGIKPDVGALNRIRNASVQVAHAPLWIDDKPGITINELRAKARRRKRESGLELIAIDYLQLMRSTSKQANGSREREIAEISAGIKSLAKELGIPIIILAQLNRGPESRTSGSTKGKPMMSDLRESGAIEQDADLVGLLYRRAYYATTDDEKEKAAGHAELVLAKNRGGETGNVPLTFIAELVRFESGQPWIEDEEKQGRWG